MDNEHNGSIAPPNEKENDPVKAIQDEETPIPPIGNVAKDNKSLQTSAAALQGLADHALHFLAHASNETLGACFVGFGAATYMLLGRVGLVIMSVAGGVVLHATWEGIRGDTRDQQTKDTELQKRREVGIDVVKRALNWREEVRSKGDTDGDTKVYTTQDLDFSSFEPKTAAALNTFVDAVIKDYVHYWYDPTIPGEDSFPASCRRTFVAFMLSLTGHLKRKRPADVFLDFVTNASSIIIVFLNELSAALSASPNSSAEEAIATYLQMKPDSSLSYILDQRSQNARLADAAEDILQAYLDPKSYNCPPVHIFLKQVLTNLVLGYTVTYCSQPHWINDWIVYGLEESETAKEVMEIVDAGVEGRTPELASRPIETETPRPEVSPVQEPAPEPQPPAEQPTAKHVHEHRRQRSKAEEAMDEAMAEAKRLTQLMIEEDEKKRREEAESQPRLSSSDDISVATTQGAPTPTSSQSDGERHEEAFAVLSPHQQEPASVETEPAEEQMSPSKQQFTNFDQLLPDPRPTALTDNLETAPPPLTLHNATVNIFDDSAPGERTSIKAKPTTDYLIQIEPATSHYPGWMIARKYADFETLHEVLRRISVITGVPQFTSAHAELPKWKTHTKASLRSELERYLTDAIRFQSLSESEGMKRFLEKDQALSRSPGQNKGFGWPTPDAFGKLGGDMMNVLTKAPKQVAGGVAGGGKAVFGGVAGLVGGVAGVAGGKKPNHSQTNLSRTDAHVDALVEKPKGHKSHPSTGQVFMTDSYLGSMTLPRESEESIRTPPKPSLERQSSAVTTGSEPNPLPSPPSARASVDLGRSIGSLARSEEPAGETLRDQPIVNLPPPPSEMPDDFDSPVSPSRSARNGGISRNSFEQAPSISRTATAVEAPPPMPPRPGKAVHAQPAKKSPPITDRETSVAVELMFAVITELYTLSSAWNIRRTLLSAAKTFLLRPGNPQLLTIKELLQTSLLDSNLNDEGLAAHIYKLRENTLPTTEELEIWARDFPEKTAEQKKELQIKARRLLVTKGMPQALSSVMGASASGEALGKVFDCLQIERVSRGLIYGLVLQALRMVTQ